MADDGGAAFPKPAEYTNDGIVVREGANGMTLRDWFAGQWLMTFRLSENGGWSAEVVAQRCYLLADAMLAERAKKDA